MKFPGNGDKMKDIKIVIGANFGDEGKGLMTNYFSSNPNTIVVCSNGGAQRGHTVFEPTTGIRHVFHHFGSGTLKGADTYLPKYYILNPIVFNQEYEELSEYIEDLNIYINPACMITTPLDMMANQIKEQSRGNNRHGSCGTGIFETITRYKAGVTALNYDIISEYYTEKFKKENIQLSKEWVATFYDKNIFKMFIEYDYPLMKQRSTVAFDNILKKYNHIVFEAGQGLLLDQNNTAYFPHLTPSNTGIKNPAEIINNINWEEEIKVETTSQTPYTTVITNEYLLILDILKEYKEYNASTMLFLLRNHSQNMEQLIKGDHISFIEKYTDQIIGAINGDVSKSKLENLDFPVKAKFGRFSPVPFSTGSPSFMTFGDTENDIEVEQSP